MTLFLLGTLIVAVTFGGVAGAIIWAGLFIAWAGLGFAAGY